MHQNNEKSIFSNSQSANHFLFGINILPLYWPYVTGI